MTDRALVTFDDPRSKVHVAICTDPIALTKCGVSRPGCGETVDETSTVTCSSCRSIVAETYSSERFEA